MRRIFFLIAFKTSLIGLIYIDNRILKQYKYKQRYIDVLNI